MAKNAYGKWTKTKIRKSSYMGLGHALDRGDVTIRQLKDYYVESRKLAMSRNRTVRKLGDEFGTINKRKFKKVRELTSPDKLIKAITDVNNYLLSPYSTIKGLKKIKNDWLKTAYKHDFFFIDDSNYGKWVDFMEWFKSSEYALKFDSNDKEVQEVFENPKASTPEEWESLFEEYLSKTGEEDEDSANGENK